VDSGPPLAYIRAPSDAGWSSPVARQAHNLKVTGSNPVPATIKKVRFTPGLFYFPGLRWEIAGFDDIGMKAGSLRMLPFP
jgi:hypothetical protein